MPEPSFKTPWVAVENYESFAINDAGGMGIAYVYFDDGDPVRKSVRNRMSKAQAKRLAERIAQIPEMVRKIEGK